MAIHFNSSVLTVSDSPDQAQRNDQLQEKWKTFCQECGLSNALLIAGQEIQDPAMLAKKNEYMTQNGFIDSDVDAVVAQSLIQGHPQVITDIAASILASEDAEFLDSDLQESFMFKYLLILVQRYTPQRIVGVLSSLYSRVEKAKQSGSDMPLIFQDDPDNQQNTH